MLCSGQSKYFNEFEHFATNNELLKATYIRSSPNLVLLQCFGRWDIDLMKLRNLKFVILKKIMWLLIQTIMILYWYCLSNKDAFVDLLLSTWIFDHMTACILITQTMWLSLKLIAIRWNSVHCFMQLSKMLAFRTLIVTVNVVCRVSNVSFKADFD